MRGGGVTSWEGCVYEAVVGAGRESRPSFCLRNRAWATARLDCSPGCGLLKAAPKNDQCVWPKPGCRAVATATNSAVAAGCPCAAMPLRCCRAEQLGTKLLRS